MDGWFAAYDCNWDTATHTAWLYAHHSAPWDCQTWALFILLSFVHVFYLIVTNKELLLEIMPKCRLLLCWLALVLVAHPNEMTGFPRLLLWAIPPSPPYSQILLYVCLWITPVLTHYTLSQAVAAVSTASSTTVYTGLLKPLVASMTATWAYIDKCITTKSDACGSGQL